MRKKPLYEVPSNTQLAALSCCMQAGIPAVLIGLPGTGKTQTIRALAKQMGLHCETITASNREPSDFGGIPMPSIYKMIDGREIKCFELATPKWACKLADQPGSILFLDELNTVPKAVEVVLMRILLDKIVGEFELPSNTIIVGAINPPDIATNGCEFSAPTANRLCHLEWKSEPKRWINGMQNGWQMELPPLLPQTWKEDYLPETIGLVTSFIQSKSHSLINVPKEESKRSEAWPSERTWDYATILMAASRSLYGECSDIENLLVSGVVGVAAAHELFAYIKNLDLPDPESLLREPHSWKPTKHRPDIIYAIINSVNTYYNYHKTIPNYYAAYNLFGQLAKPENNMADLAVIGLQFLTKNHPPNFQGAMGDPVEYDKQVGWVNRLTSGFMTRISSK